MRQRKVIIIYFVFCEQFLESLRNRRVGEIVQGIGDNQDFCRSFEYDKEIIQYFLGLRWDSNFMVKDVVFYKKVIVLSIGVF